MAVWNVVHKGVYHDSVTLMRLTHDLERLSGLRRAAAMMGTPANRELLQDTGLLTAEGDASSPQDLIIAIEADEEAVAHAGIQAVEAALADTLPSTVAPDHSPRPRTLSSALRQLDGANLALISVPGMYAGYEAMKALGAGLHVMLFSDNMPLATEIELKRLALAKGLLMMGPDCGTAIINGVPLGFANAIARGRIGIAAASGSGTQEVSCLIAAAGEGISQAIGVGGRDLSDEVGGLMMGYVLDILALDPATDVICVLGKPPGPSTWERLQGRLVRLDKPCVVYMPGLTAEAESPWSTAETLEDTAHMAVALAQSRRPTPRAFPAPTYETMPLVREALRTMRPGQRLVRGIYAGGTLAQEALGILRATLSDVSPDLLGEGEGHTVVDLGADRFTVGRPHPMIDGGLRREWVLKAASDPSTAVILFDVILGYGAHPDPAGELLPAIQQATRQARDDGRSFTLVASVCGTDRDPQRRSAQVEALCASGVMVMPSNAQAARLAAWIADHLAWRGQRG
jgi:FdrA protein